MKHHTLLHEHFVGAAGDAGDGNNAPPPPPPPADDGPPGAAEAPAAGAPPAALCGLVRSFKKDTFLQVVPVILQSKEAEILTYALLDDGSQKTLLRDDIAQKLKLPWTPQLLSITTVVEKAGEPIQAKESAISVLSKDKDFKLDIEDVSIVPADKFNMPSRPRLQDGDYFTCLDGIVIDSIAPEEITLLIGGDEQEAHIQSDVRRGRKDQPLAIKTPFGWTLFGSSREGKKTSCNTVTKIP